MDWYVYIISTNSHTLYTGLTDNLPRRLFQHKTKTFRNAFTARYTFDRLVYFETLESRREAAKRERQIKSWSRAKRVALIQTENPNWVDLSMSWTDALMLH
ncbi:MAG TPA: GIY-YIG nuclease family protein [Thermoanaerobaculia bacterium]